MVVLSFDQPSYSLSEASASIEVCINLFGDVEKTIAANLSTSDGSALGTYHTSHVRLGAEGLKKNILFNCCSWGRLYSCAVC